MAAPLEGIRVLEVANYLAAPGCGALMADMGADVVKVEPPEGDIYRGRHRGSGDPVAYPFAVDNRGKRSMTLDLGRPEARDVLLRVARASDVFLTNLTPERLRRYGLTFEDLSASAPGIVFAILTAYGAEGPEADRQGFDGTAFFARAGTTSLVGEEGSPPVQWRAGQGDHMTALGLLASILAALRLREQTGEAQFVDVSLFRTGVYAIAADIQHALNREGHEFEPQNREKHWQLTRNSYPTKDGRWLQITMAVVERYWPRLCEAIERPELAADARYATADAMRQNGPALLPELDEIFRGRTLEEWRPRLDATNCIWAPVALPSEVIHDPQLRSQGAFERITQDDGVSYEVVSAPFRIRGADVRPRGPVPALGAHTHQVLCERGFSDEEIATLAEGGLFG